MCNSQKHCCEGYERSHLKTWKLPIKLQQFNYVAVLPQNQYDKQNKSLGIGQTHQILVYIKGEFQLA